MTNAGGRGLAWALALTVGSRKPAGEFGSVVLQILMRVERKSVNFVAVVQQNTMMLQII